MKFHAMCRTHAIWMAATCAAVLTGCRNEQAGEQASGKPQAGAPPNVVLICVDTLRPDHLGCYGYSRATSPRMDRLAAEGALFEHTVSSTSWTFPAHCALFTGLVDSVHGSLDWQQPLAPDRVTLAERLKEAGYTTVGFFSASPLHPAFGLGQGFDEYVDCSSVAERSRQMAEAGRLPAGTDILKAGYSDITNPRVVAAIREWLAKPRPSFFMFIHMWDVHADYIPPPPYDRMFDPDYDGPITGRDVALDPAINAQMPRRDIDHLVALYDGEIAWTDEHVGQILDALDAAKLRDSTLVVLLADHGEEFFEHGEKVHRKSLYDEVVRIPLLVRLPGRVPAGQRYAEQARIIDVVPTVLDLAGLPPAAGVMGQSLAPLFAGGALQDDPLAVSELFVSGFGLCSYRRNERKLIDDLRNQRQMMFDLVVDPGELHPLRDAAGLLAQALARDVRLADQWLDDFRAAWPKVAAGSLTMPEHVRRDLESLGYLHRTREEPASAPTSQPTSQTSQPASEPAGAY